MLHPHRDGGRVGAHAPALLAHDVAADGARQGGDVPLRHSCGAGSVPRRAAVMGRKGTWPMALGLAEHPSEHTDGIWSITELFSRERRVGDSHNRD